VISAIKVLEAILLIKKHPRGFSRGMTYEILPAPTIDELETAYQSALHAQVDRIVQTIADDATAETQAP